MTPKVNKWLDLVDRAGWTAVQASAGAALAAITLDLDWGQFFTIVATATAVAVLKVIVGQNTGAEETGSLIGQSVIEPPPTAK